MKIRHFCLGWWLVTGSSIIPVLALNLCKGDVVLDMCAAPGGKSLQIIQTGLVGKIRYFYFHFSYFAAIFYINFWHFSGKLVCNDYKLSRLGDLKRSLSIYIPVNSDESKAVFLKRKDASDLTNWDEFGLYDKVLRFFSLIEFVLIVYISIYQLISLQIIRLIDLSFYVSTGTKYQIIKKTFDVKMNILSFTS